MFAMGGTLVQHVDEHMRIDMYNQDVHAVDIDPASRLASIVGTEVMGVNSLHHQVIDRLGPGVRAVAHNNDGHIEAIEIEVAPAVIGVQWHPELMRHRGDHLALFEDLVRQVVARRAHAEVVRAVDPPHTPFGAGGPVCGPRLPNAAPTPERLEP